MTGIILGALAVMWVVVLGWEALTNVREGRRRSDPMRHFKTQLNVLGRTVPKTVAAANKLAADTAPIRTAAMSTPRGATAAANRRRNVSLMLGAGLVLAGVIWFVTSTPIAGGAVLFFGGLLIAFSYLSMRRRQLEDERSRVVSYLPTAGRALEPAPARRQAN